MADLGKTQVRHKYNKKDSDGLSIKVYHGSNVKVELPRLIVGDHSLDFGLGFYTTTNLEQAKGFAHKVVDRNEGRGDATVSIFEFDDEAARNSLDILTFSGPNDAWLDFVVDNRLGRYAGSNYDIKIGPVANDNVYRTIQLYMTGVLSRENAIRELKIRELFNQVVFSSEKSLQMIHFVGSVVIK